MSPGPGKGAGPDGKRGTEEEKSLGGRSRGARGFLGGWDIPFEFVGEIARSCAVAEARNVQRGSGARHLALSNRERPAE